ncbi:MAG: ABC transporter permease [Lachnospiraceae bacterium]|jgi:peptide/nickel transport system permease protein|nr:ABC transporter permease [Lachnospiraceae bacterium]
MKKQAKRHGQLYEIVKRFSKRKIAVVAFFVLVVMLALCLGAPIFAPYDYALQDPFNTLAMPSWQHPFGTDGFGRDIFTRILYGGRNSLLISLFSSLISVVGGGIIGAISGYYGGKTDNVIMRLVDVFMAIPGILLCVVISAALGTGPWQTCAAVAIGGIPGGARILRAQVLALRKQEYIEAAGAYGSSDMRIVLTHVVPNCLAPVIVDTTLRLGMNIMMISGLAFIGLGVQAPHAEWGAMLNSGREYIRDFWPLITFPGLAIVISMLGFNLFGDGLRDALDPKLKT